MAPLHYDAVLQTIESVFGTHRKVQPVSDILQMLMQGGVSSITPYKIHTLSAQLRNTFANYLQQDSQEVVYLWVSTLSEELNRVKNGVQLQVV